MNETVESAWRTQALRWEKIARKTLEQQRAGLSDLGAVEHLTPGLKVAVKRLQDAEAGIEKLHNEMQEFIA